MPMMAGLFLFISHLEVNLEIKKIGHLVILFALAVGFVFLEQAVLPLIGFPY